MNESVLITGAGTDFGLAAALRLAGRGFEVFATVPDPAQGERVLAAAAASGVGLHVLPLDTTDPDGVERAVAAVVARAGGIYALVNDAGVDLRGFFEEMAENEIRRTFEVNVFAAMTVTRAVLPHLRASRRGRIVFLSSVGGRIGAPRLTGYCAAKFALEGLAESLALEVSPLGIFVSLIEPGPGRAEGLDEGMVGRTRSADAAEAARAIERALTVRRPRLRYVVGRAARLMVRLQRFLPTELFDRLYPAQLAGPISVAK
jgi:NAD(P)-dependent dehydrogenase (short-subunit alcohol dehydrogenase family)